MVLTLEKLKPYVVESEYKSMTNMRKFAAALVLGLVMCLALFTTGAFAQSAHRGHIGIVSVNSVAVAGGDGFGFGDFGGFGFGFGGFGCGCCHDFGFGGAFAHASVNILGAGW